MLYYHYILIKLFVFETIVITDSLNEINEYNSVF
jgi:hypothetical protein